MGPLGAAPIASALQHLGSLEVLNLGYTSLGPAGCAEIYRALRSNTTLTKLDLRGCDIDAQTKMRLQRLAAARVARADPELVVSFDGVTV